MQHMLEVKNLAITAGGCQIFRDLSFVVPRGSSLAVLGPNGAGKTMLLQALIGLQRYEGEVRWSPETRIGYVPQKLDIERDLPITGRDFLAAKAAVVNAPKAAFEQALSQVRIGDAVARRLIGTLSGGQFQRLLVACALLGHPNVLLLDEAMAGVDEPGQEQLYEMIHRLQRENGLTIILVSHELSVVYRYASDVLCMSRDAPHLVGPPKNLTPQLLKEIYGTESGFHSHGDHGH